MKDTFQRKRIYEAVLEEHLRDNRQMAFLTGPRQCGKTTLAKSLSDKYFTWDDLATRRLVAGDAAGLADAAGLGIASNRKTVITLDEIHKFVRWKSFLKGFFDLYEDRMRLIVTGSARLGLLDMSFSQVSLHQETWQFKDAAKEYRLTYFGKPEIFGMQGGIAGALIKGEGWEKLCREGAAPEGTFRAEIED